MRAAPLEAVLLLSGLALRDLRASGFRGLPEAPPSGASRKAAFHALDAGNKAEAALRCPEASSWPLKTGAARGRDTASSPQEPLPDAASAALCGWRCDPQPRRAEAEHWAAILRTEPLLAGSHLCLPEKASSSALGRLRSALGRHSARSPAPGTLASTPTPAEPSRSGCLCAKSTWEPLEAAAVSEV